MSKPKIPNQNKEYKKLNERLNKYALMVEDMYEALALEAAKKVAMVGYDGTVEFHFDDYPQLKAQVDEMMSNWVADMDKLIYQGTSTEWMNSNVVQTLLADKVLKAYTATVDREKYKVYYDPNSQALQAFQKRRDRGMNLSDKLWRQESSLRNELEEAISCAIQKGTSAVALSKRISKYLNDYPSLQKDYGRLYGKATRSSDCEYRSMRLARSEINMAYRGAENERWRQFDFVVGYEIKVSHKHRVPDICDELQGKYPKDFEWVGWHPNCTDYKIPILKTEDEFFSLDDKPSVNEVTDVPSQFKQWVVDNQASIKRAEARGTAPYFVRDNRKLVDGIIEYDNKIAYLKNVVRYIPSEYKADVEYWIAHKPSLPHINAGLKRIASRLESTTDSYLSDIASRSSVVRTMVDELKSDKVQNGDFKYRIDLINEIKRKCSIVTRWNLRKAGFVDGLDFVGLERSKVFTNSGFYRTSSGEVVGVKELKRDVVHYKDKYGYSYYYPLGARRTNVPYSAKEASEVFTTYLDGMKKKFKGVFFDTGYNPMDEYYRKEYPNFTYGAMYSGDIVKVHGKKIAKDDFRGAFSHEIGYKVDKNHMYSSSRGWIEAVKNDARIVSDYSKSSLSEDFAESFRTAYYFIENNIENAFERMYPNRWRILKPIFDALK